MVFKKKLKFFVEVLIIFLFKKFNKIYVWIIIVFVKKMKKEK